MSAPPPAVLAAAEAWSASAGVDRSIVPQLAVAVTEHGRSFPFWELLLRVAPDYTSVADALEAHGLPVALAAIPLGLSHYDANASRPDCGAGPWLLLPGDPNVRVSNCRLKAAPLLWSPPEPLEGGVAADGACRIGRCEVDQRRDLAVSTAAAIANIEATWIGLPPGGDRLRSVVADLSGEEPALVLARHLLAACFYASADASWSARWRPAPAWCADVLPYPAAEVGACAGVSGPPPSY